MSRRTWAGIGIAAAAAALLLVMQVPHSADTHTRKQASEPVVPNPKQEHMSKHSLMAQDIDSTDRLTRLDAKQHLVSMIERLGDAGPAQITDDIRKLQKSHDHFTMIIWQEAKHGKQRVYDAAKNDWSADDRKTLKGYLSKAESSIHQQRSYESPSFKLDGKQYFVIAEPSKNKPKQGVIALMNQKILTEVANHQKKTCGSSRTRKRENTRWNRFMPIRCGTLPSVRGTTTKKRAIFMKTKSSFVSARILPGKR